MKSISVKELEEFTSKHKKGYVIINVFYINKIGLDIKYHTHT